MPDGATVIPNGGGGATIFHDGPAGVLGSLLRRFGMGKGPAATPATAVKPTGPDVTIVLPRGSDVTVMDVSQGVTFSGEFGEVDTHETVKGPVVTEGTFTNARLFVEDGDITIQSVPAGATFTARVKGDAGIEGRGAVALGQVYGSGKATTTNGPITVEATNPDGMVDLTSERGHITVTTVIDRGAANAIYTETKGRESITWSDETPPALPIPSPTRPGLRAEDLAGPPTAQPGTSRRFVGPAGLPPQTHGGHRSSDGPRPPKSSAGPTGGF